MNIDRLLETWLESSEFFRNSFLNNKYSSTETKFNLSVILLFCNVRKAWINIMNVTCNEWSILLLVLSFLEVQHTIEYNLCDIRKKKNASETLGTRTGTNMMIQNYYHIYQSDSRITAYAIHCTLDVKSQRTKEKHARRCPATVCSSTSISFIRVEHYNYNNFQSVNN